MNKKAFTLVELLAVIVILAIILAVAVPNITGIVDSAKANAFEDNAKLLIKAINNQKAYDETFDYTGLDKDKVKSILNVPNDNYQTVEVVTENNKPSVTIVGQNKWAGLTASGTYNNITVTETGTTTPSDTTPPVITIVGNSAVSINQGSTYADAGATAADDVDGDITANIVPTSNVNTNVAGTYTVTYNVSDAAGNSATPVVRTVTVVQVEIANAPALVTGMTPIKWDGNAWIDTTSSDTNWYSYDTTNKKWANAKTADGSMWVWIPRYIYKISSGWHSSTTGTINIQFSSGTNDNWNNSNIGNIDTGTTASASNDKWTNHPAFTFGTTEVTGIWVAKFEATAAEGVSNNTTCATTNDNVITKTVKIIPSTQTTGVLSWRCINVGNIFTVSRNMEINNTYGWGTTGAGIDTHLTKNIEWGAVLYLATSSYGKVSEIWVNNNGYYRVGCAGNSVTAAYYTGECSNLYSSANGVNASTTGNIYGIYDMSGGAVEYTAAYINNNNAKLTTFASSLLGADSKYKDLYTVGTSDTNTNNYTAAANKKGDAIYEISSSYTGDTAWNADTSDMSYTNWPLFQRGGPYGYTTQAGAFKFTYEDGANAANYGFRPTLIVNEGL